MDEQEVNVAAAQALQDVSARGRRLVRAVLVGAYLAGQEDGGARDAALLKGGRNVGLILFAWGRPASRSVGVWLVVGGGWLQAGAW